MKPHSRRLILDEVSPQTTLTPLMTYSPEPTINTTSSPTQSTPFKPKTAFDSSMALTALVVLTALFFMGFFSLYLRRFTDDGTRDRTYRRRLRTLRNQQPNSSSWLYPWNCNANKGLDPSTVRSLPQVPYGGDAKHPDECAICLSDFEEGETVKLIPHCRHVFHPVCIDTWLSSRVTCPICRSTEMLVADEVRLGVSQLEGNDPSPEQSAVQNGEALAEVGPVGLRRTCSCSRLEDSGVVLRRSLSF